VIDGDDKGRQMAMDGNCDGDCAVAQSASMSFGAMACRRENNYFFLLHVFLYLNSLFHFFNGSCSLFFLSFVQRVGRDGNKEMMFEEMKKAKCLPIWSSFDKFA
jgi:hypothetical protein